MKLTETIETWAPVSHRISGLFPLSFVLIEHLLPTRLTTFWCCFGVRWLTKIPDFASSVVCFLQGILDLLLHRVTQCSMLWPMISLALRSTVVYKLTTFTTPKSLFQNLIAAVALMGHFIFFGLSLSYVSGSRFPFP
jgi:succinate dehydrogenase/fumarate reductase cytochrome b subunit